MRPGPQPKRLCVKGKAIPSMHPSPVPEAIEFGARLDAVGIRYRSCAVQRGGAPDFRKKWTMNENDTLQALRHLDLLKRPLEMCLKREKREKTRVPMSFQQRESLEER